MSLEGFVAQVPDFDALTKSEQVRYFVYYLVNVAKRPAASPAEVRQCFEQLHIEPYSNIPSLLARYSKRGKGKLYIRSNGGYLLERAIRSDIESQLRPTLTKRTVSQRLRDLEIKVKSARERSFLSEAIDCFEVGAMRAAIIMTWVLSTHHLCEYVLAQKLADFNQVLGTNTDKRIKVKSVQTLDDFSDIPEGKLIELCRAARIISNDVRKILSDKLDIRNSAAHPSGVSISEIKAMDFIIDLVDNVVLKYEP